MKPARLTIKQYKCSKCGHVRPIETNHYGSVYTGTTYLKCPTCPPYAKYAWLGGSTEWVCMEQDPNKTKDHDNAQSVND